MARLVIYSSGAVNQTVELTGQNVRIGRAEENDVVLADPTQVVSRFHAELRCEDGHHILLDLNSANGTWVWDHRIQRIVLDSGTVAEIGSYRLALETDADAPPVPAVVLTPPFVPEPTGTADDSVSTAARAVIQPEAEASTTGSDRRGRSAETARLSKTLIVAGVALLGLALVAVGIAAVLRFLPGEPSAEGPHPNQAGAATAPAQPLAVSGPPADPPVVPAATSAEKQDVGAPAVPARPAAAREPRFVPSAASAPPAEARLDAVRVVQGVPRRAGESQAEYAARVERLRALYGDAEAAMAGGAAAERRGDFVEAQRAYERAAEADPASGADEALGRVRARMKTLGDDAFKRARTFDALGRTEDAIAQYERAIQLLAPEDPSRKTATQRLDVLRAVIIK